MPLLPNVFNPVRDFNATVVTQTVWMESLYTPEEILPLPPPTVDCKTFAFVPVQPSLLTKVVCLFNENLPELPQLRVL